MPTGSTPAPAGRRTTPTSRQGPTASSSWPATAKARRCRKRAWEFCDRADVLPDALVLGRDRRRWLRSPAGARGGYGCGRCAVISRCCSTSGTRLSREIHDTLLQSLVGVALQFDALAGELPSSSGRTKEQLVRMRKQVEEHIREARHSIWNLRSPTLRRRDLGTALRAFAEQASGGGRHRRRRGSHGRAAAADTTRRGTAAAHRPGGDQQRGAPLRRQPHRRPPRLRHEGRRPERRGRRPRLRFRPEPEPAERPLRADHDEGARGRDRRHALHRAARAGRHPGQDGRAAVGALQEHHEERADVVRRIRVLCVDDHRHRPRGHLAASSTGSPTWKSSRSPRPARKRWRCTGSTGPTSR